MEESSFLGIAQNGKFWLLQPPSRLGHPVRLTVNPAQAGQPPESGELDLRRYEGRALMVEGRVDSGWIFGARIVDEAGPILTAVVQQVFGRTIKRV